VERTVSADQGLRVRRARPPRWRKYVLPYLFISPWLIGVLVFFAYPIISSLYYGFTQYDVFTDPVWVGTRNYQELLKDRYFIQAISNTMIFVVFAVPGALVMGFTQALLLNFKLRGQQVFRTLALVPGTVPVAAAAAVWLYILSPGPGLVNSIFRTFGMANQKWIADPDAVKWVFVGLDIWAGTGMLVFLASLQSVPDELLDAAKVDGANAFHRLIHITIPVITPAVLFNMLMGLINAFQYFAFPLLLTNGGPVGGSTFFGQNLYDNAFTYYKMGYASAQAWILFIICAIVVFLVFRSSARWVYYEAE
jgi:multiple sugar transport system permease protein